MGAHAEAILVAGKSFVLETDKGQDKACPPGHRASAGYVGASGWKQHLSRTDSRPSLVLDSLSDCHTTSFQRPVSPLTLPPCSVTQSSGRPWAGYSRPSCPTRPCASGAPSAFCPRCGCKDFPGKVPIRMEKLDVRHKDPIPRTQASLHTQKL